VSRLFPDRLVIRLSPAEVAAARFRGFVRKRIVETRSVACDPAFGTEPWHGALAAIDALEIAQPCAVTVILSNHFVRYAVVPWSDALDSPAEEDAYVRHHFVKIHGERAKTWLLRSSESAGGAPRLVSAVDAGLIEALGKRFPKGGKARLASVQPQLMSKFNEWRGLVPAQGAWLVLAEPDRACVALHAGGRWRAVQNGKEPWLELLERARYRVHDADPGALPDVVLLGGAAQPDAPGGRWKFHVLT
jgi:hypothetical protein